MKTLRALGTVAVASTALTVVAAFPAAADDTTTTFTLTGGSLAYSAPLSAALGDSSSGETAITGQLGTVSVTDARGGVAGWVVSGTSTSFTHASDATAGSTSTAIEYSPGTVDTTGVSSVAGPAGTALSGSTAPVTTATGVSGNNTASWNPTLDVTLPSSSLAGSYTGTVTTSVV